MAAGTLQGDLGKNDAVVARHFDPVYLEGYFFSTNRIYDRTFIAKYKHLFELP